MKSPVMLPPQYSMVPAACSFQAWIGVSLHWLFMAVLAAFPAALSAQTTLNITRGGGSFQLSASATTLHYYGLEHSADLQGFSLLKMALGMTAPVFTYTPQAGEARGFFRAQLIDVFSPGDADRDGIDDLWELQHDLDPLAAADALQPSAQDPARTNVEHYRGIFGLAKVTEFYSTEASVVNRPFALSEETSVYNFTTLATLHAVSAEVSLYNFALVGDPSVAVFSSEVSVYNTYAPPLASQVFSEEVSLFNAYSPQPAPQVVSAEVSVFNDLSTEPLPQVVSAEVSVFNSYTLEPSPQAMSAEVSVFNFYSVQTPVSAISPEVTVLKTQP